MGMASDPSSGRLACGLRLSARLNSCSMPSLTRHHIARAFNLPGGRSISQPAIKLELSSGSYIVERGEGWSSQVEDEVADKAPLWARPCDEPIEVALQRLPVYLKELYKYSILVIL